MSATQPTKETQQYETKKEPMRAVIEYRWTPMDEAIKPKTFQRVIEAATDSQHALKEFWKGPVWIALTKKIEILSITWPDED